MSVMSTSCRRPMPGLQAFMRDIDPKLSYFLPGESVPFKTASSALDTP